MFDCAAVEIRQAGDYRVGIINEVDLVAEIGGPVQALGIPAKVLSRHVYACNSAIVLLHGMIMFDDQRVLLRQSRIGQSLTGLQPVHHLPE